MGLVAGGGRGRRGGGAQAYVFIVLTVVLFVFLFLWFPFGCLSLSLTLSAYLSISSFFLLFSVSIEHTQFRIKGLKRRALGSRGGGVMKDRCVVIV